MAYILSHLPLSWFILGLFLIAAELIVPGGFVLMLIGLAALTVSLFSWVFTLSIGIQVLLFFIAVFMYTFLLKENLKSILKRKGNEEDPENEFVGKKATALTSIDSESGRVEYKGSQWPAKSESLILPGDEVEILEQESITLYVKPLNKK